MMRATGHHFMNIFRTFISASARRTMPTPNKPPPAPTVPTAIKSREDAKLGDGSGYDVQDEMTDHELKSRPLPRVVS